MTKDKPTNFFNIDSVEKKQIINPLNVSNTSTVAANKIYQNNSQLDQSTSSNQAAQHPLKSFIETACEGFNYEDYLKSNQRRKLDENFINKLSTNLAVHYQSHLDILKEGYGDNLGNFILDIRNLICQKAFNIENTSPDGDELPYEEQEQWEKDHEAAKVIISFINKREKGYRDKFFEFCRDIGFGSNINHIKEIFNTDKIQNSGDVWELVSHKDFDNLFDSKRLPLNSSINPFFNQKSDEAKYDFMILLSGKSDKNNKDALATKYARNNIIIREKRGGQSIYHVIDSPNIEILGYNKISSHKEYSKIRGDRYTNPRNEVSVDNSYFYEEKGPFLILKLPELKESRKNNKDAAKLYKSAKEFVGFVHKLDVEHDGMNHVFALRQAKGSLIKSGFINYAGLYARYSKGRDHNMKWDFIVNQPTYYKDSSDYKNSVNDRFMHRWEPASKGTHGLIKDFTFDISKNFGINLKAERAEELFRTRGQMKVGRESFFYTDIRDSEILPSEKLEEFYSFVGNNSAKNNNYTGSTGTQYLVCLTPAEKLSRNPSLHSKKGSVILNEHIADEKSEQQLKDDLATLLKFCDKQIVPCLTSRGEYSQVDLSNKEDARDKIRRALQANASEDKELELSNASEVESETPNDPKNLIFDLLKEEKNNQNQPAKELLTNFMDYNRFKNFVNGLYKEVLNIQDIDNYPNKTLAKNIIESLEKLAGFKKEEDKHFGARENKIEKVINDLDNMDIKKLQPLIDIVHQISEESRLKLAVFGAFEGERIAENVKEDEVEDKKKNGFEKKGYAKYDQGEGQDTYLMEKHTGTIDHLTAIRKEMRTNYNEKQPSTLTKIENFFKLGPKLKSMDGPDINGKTR